MSSVENLSEVPAAPASENSEKRSILESLELRFNITKQSKATANELCARLDKAFQDSMLKITHDVADTDITGHFEVRRQKPGKNLFVATNVEVTEYVDFHEDGRFYSYTTAKKALCSIGIEGKIVAVSTGEGCYYFMPKGFGKKRVSSAEQAADFLKKIYLRENERYGRERNLATLMT